MNAGGIAAGATALAVSLVLTPLVDRVCKRLSILDQPGPMKIHSRPIPRLGGVAIAMAIAAGVIAAAAGGTISVARVSIAAAFILLWLIGLIDDLHGLSPIIRLVVQILSALLLWLAGLRIPVLGSTAGSIVATCLFVIAFVNAFNFLDGSDGLAAGVAGIVALAFIFAPGFSHARFGYPVAWGVAGACAGFLVFNFPPARIFMGDSGSTVLGFLLALLTLDFCSVSRMPMRSVAFALVAASLPLLDAALAIIRRVRRASSPFAGDRRHFYDLLLARDWPPRTVAFVSYAITFILAATGWLALRANSLRFMLPGGVTLALVFGAALRLGSLRGEKKSVDSAKARTSAKVTTHPQPTAPPKPGLRA